MLEPYMTTLFTYFQDNLAKGFIHQSTIIPVPFVCFLKNSPCSCIDYQDLNQISVRKDP